MSKVTVKCSNPNCGIFFETWNAFGGKDSTVTFNNVGMGKCPRCGSIGKIMDGTYRFDSDGIMRVLSGPQFTTEVLVKLQHVAEVAQTESYTPNKFITEVSLGLSDTLLNLFVPQDAGDFYSFLQFLIILIPKLLRRKKSGFGEKKYKKKKSKKAKTRDKDIDEYKLRREYYKGTR
jgi:hypothetical protein